MKLEGIYAPIPTPFDENGSLYLEGLTSNFVHWLGSPLDGIVAGGSNGEWPLLTFDERVALFGACADLSRGKLKVCLLYTSRCV